MTKLKTGDAKASEEKVEGGDKADNIRAYDMSKFHSMCPDLQFIGV